MTAARPLTAAVNFADPVDAWAYGEHRGAVVRTPEFTARIGDSAHPAQPHRYHIYASWTCLASHRVDILRRLAGLTSTVSLSYVDSVRDGRGWAFREVTGPDPRNGFTLLRQAFRASRAGYFGPVTVPVLWDGERHRIVSTDPDAIGHDLIGAFDTVATVRPPRRAAEIDRASRWVRDAIETTAARAVRDPSAAAALGTSLQELDTTLAGQRHLLGDALTEADVRLWVALLRFDAGVNAHGRFAPPLTSFPALWRWASELHAREAFQAATNVRRFAPPLADVERWLTASFV